MKNMRYYIRFIHICSIIGKGSAVRCYWSWSGHRRIYRTELLQTHWYTITDMPETKTIKGLFALFLCVEHIKECHGQWQRRLSSVNTLLNSIRQTRRGQNVCTKKNSGYTNWNYNEKVQIFKIKFKTPEIISVILCMYSWNLNDGI